VYKTLYINVYYTARGAPFLLKFSLMGEMLIQLWSSSCVIFCETVWSRYSRSDTATPLPTARIAHRKFGSDMFDLFFMVSLEDDLGIARLLNNCKNKSISF